MGDILLTDEEIHEVLWPGWEYRKPSLYEKNLCKAQHKKDVEWLDENNGLIKHESPNYPDHCGLLIPLEKWQDFKQAQEVRR